MNTNTQKRMLIWIIGLLIAILLCCVTVYLKNDSQNIVIIGIEVSMIFFLILSFSSIILFSYFIWMNNLGKGLEIAVKILVDLMIDYRYWIISVVFLLLVALGVNFSSLSTWETYTYEQSHSIIFGEARPVRSDEWLVETPWILSQYDEGFPIVNGDIRVDGQNMLFMSTKAPIMHISTIGNPYNWGYLFLPIEQGFSWHWISKLLLLLLFSYEFLYIITKKSRYVSFIGAFWIAFSPPITWWFDTSIIELVIAFQAILVGVNYYFKVKSTFIKIALASLIVVFSLNFTLDLYPPFQIVLGYVVSVFLIYLLWNNRRYIKKKDVGIIFFTTLIIVTIVAISIIPSIPDIMILLSTSYPGRRVQTGGGASIFNFSRYIYSWALPFKNVPEEALQNNCFASAYVTFIPVSLIIIWKNWKEKTNLNNSYLKIFIFIYIVLSAWIICPFPDFLSKITLLFLVTPQMGLMGVGILGIYISAIIISQLNSEQMIFSKIEKIMFISILGSYFLLSIYFNQAVSYLGVIGISVSIILFLVINYFFMSGKKKIVLISIVIISIIPGCFVNPINVGLAPIIETSVAKTIQEVIESDSEGLWMGYGSITLADYILAQGGKVINSVHYYPNNNLWKKISNNSSDYEIYNRFAHIEIVFEVDAETKFELVGMDYIKIKMNIEDIEKLNIKYIVSEEPLEKFSNQSISFLKKNTFNNQRIFIYKVVY